MLGSSSGGILGCKEHGPNPRIAQITTDELLELTPTTTEPHQPMRQP
jgi:hypothetical protein